MQAETTTIKIALADDHLLLRQGLANVVNGFDNCKVILEAGNGEELITGIKSGSIPDIVVMDLNMPGMDGYDATRWLQMNYPEIQVLMLTMFNTELIMLRLLQVGIKGFLKKDSDPGELRFAINSIKLSGYYYNNTTGKLVNLFRKSQDPASFLRTMLTEMEIRFLKLACTELTYKEIAVQMHLNPRAIDNLRDNLFGKLDIKSRVGLAMYAVTHGIKII